jgi:hypothetical protein
VDQWRNETPGTLFRDFTSQLHYVILRIFFFFFFFLDGLGLFDLWPFRINPEI